MKRFVCFLIAGLLMTASAFAWTFTNVTDEMIPGFDRRVGAVAWGDVNNDGSPDLFVGGTGDSPSALYINDNGILADGTVLFGLPTLFRVRSAQWIDFDSDGLLDLMTLRERSATHIRTTPSIRLFKQNANHRFQEVTLTGVNLHDHIRSAVWTDINDDGRLDLVLSNNQDHGTVTILEQDQLQFVEQRGGIADLQMTGVGAMCVVDFDNDGDKDIFMGSGLGQGVSHFLRNDNGQYVDVAREMNLPIKVAAHGAVWADFHQDGYMSVFAPGDDAHADLLTVKPINNNLHFVGTGLGDNLFPKGARSDFAHAIDANMDGRLDLFIPREGLEGSSLLVNTVSDGWVDVAEDVGLQLRLQKTRDGAWADIDGDGDLDLAMAQGADGLKLFRNECDIEREFIIVRLTGPDALTPQVDCGVKMDFRAATLIKTTSAVTCGSAYDYSDLLIVNPNLGNSPEPILSVRWPNGVLTTYDISVLQMNQVNVFSQPTQDNEGENDRVVSLPTHVGNSPNPFNPNTMIDFTIPEAGNVQLSVFNLLGQEVATLANRDYAAGSHRVDFNASNLPSGLYFARLTAVGQTRIHRMILAK